MSLTYRDSDHSYFWQGKQVPGITRILSDLGCYPGSGWFTEQSRIRGQQGHLACQLADQHCKSAQSLDEALEVLDAADDIQGYLAGYLKFRRESKYLSERWEHPVFSRRLMVAGRPDTSGRMVYIDRARAVLDVKTWANQGADPKHSAEVQTAFYAISLAEEWNCNPLDIERYTLKLPGDGNYRLYHCTDASDYEEATWACWIWWNWHNKGIFKFAGDPENEQIGEMQYAQD